MNKFDFQPEGTGSINETLTEFFYLLHCYMMMRYSIPSNRPFDGPTRQSSIFASFIFLRTQKEQVLILHDIHSNLNEMRNWKTLDSCEFLYNTTVRTL